MRGVKAAKTWLASALRRGARGDADVAAKVNVTLGRVVAGGFQYADCEACLAQMLAFEREGVNCNSYRYPFYVWRRQVSADNKTRFKEGWRTAFDAAQTTRQQVAVLALAARIAPLNKPFSSAMDALTLDSSADMDTALSIDLCGLLHSQRRYQDLLMVTEALLDRADKMAMWESSLICDFHFQASYQRLKIKIFRNNITADDVGLLQSTCERCCAVLGHENGNVHHYRGLLACVQGDLEGAVKYHLEARKRPTYNSQFFSAALNTVPIEEMRALAEVAPRDYTGNPAFYGEIRMNFRHAPGGDMTLIACDEGYFKSFARGFCESFGLQNSGALVHVHAIGFEPSQEALDALERDFAIAINVTVDPGPDEAGSGDLFRGYCAGSRYIHLPRYQEHYSRIIVNDIDGIVHTSMADIWAGREGQIQLSTPVLDADRKGHFAFWSNIGAGAFGIGNLDSHKQFSAALANYLTMRFNACRDGGERFFFSDQVGLLLCVLAFRGEVPMVKMPQLFSQSTQTSHVGRDDAKKNSQSRMLEKLSSAKDKTPGG